MEFKKATKQQAKLRMAIIGPSGSGKTYTALTIAQRLGKRIALIDTERGSASKYADLFQFDVLELSNFSPENYMEAIKAAEQAGYDVLVIDSLSHAWSGTGGILEYVDQQTMRSQSKNAYTEGWRKATPLHNKMVDTILQTGIHVIATMRAKTAYVMETDSRGKNTPKKVGMEAVQRDGLEYEFDIVADMNLDNDLIVSKTRCSALIGAIINKPKDEPAQTLVSWLTSGTPYQPPKKIEHVLDGGKPEYQTGAESPTKPSTPVSDSDKPAFPNGRPWAPDKLVEMIQAKAKKYRGSGESWGGEPPDGLRGAMVGALNDLFGKDDDKRHTFLRVVTGDPSSKSTKMDHAMCKAIMDWLEKSDARVSADEANRLVSHEIGAQAVGELFPS